MENNTEFSKNPEYLSPGEISEANQQLGFLSQASKYPEIEETSSDQKIQGELSTGGILLGKIRTLDPVLDNQESFKVEEEQVGNQESSLEVVIDEKDDCFYGNNQEADSESFLEMKKKLLLEELDSMLVPEENTNNLMVIDGEAIADQQKIPDNMNVLKGNSISLRNSLKIEVIDETALVEPVFVSGNENGENEMGIICPSRSKQMKLNKNAETETEGKKNKRSRRRARETKIPQIHRVQERTKNVEGKKVMYLRKEMEALRFVNVVEQRKLWKAIYKKLLPSVAKEYSSLTSTYSNRPKKMGVSSDPIIRKECSESLDDVIENMEGDNENKFLGSPDPSCSHIVGDSSNTVLEEEYCEASDDDKYYSSIQRPAFSVEGEPNFDSGPPEDGLEYLRRVKWEASHIPNVAVAKVDRSKFKKEQSVYMPVIPVIADCPEHLLPSKQWEDAFLADFSELRQALSCFEEQERTAEDPESMMPSDIVFHEKFYSIIPNPNDRSSDLPSEDINLQQLQKTTASPSVKDSCSGYPYLSAILKMDSVFRVSSLRKRISSVETKTTLSRTDCVWLFALSAAVDTPLDADTSAAFRSLLRKCASLRAEKAELDDEVIMLNILATISGRYFGQSEN